ncbi:hypothetical protein CYMTET_48609 [Cymbomonas tetramitiformis]|uniref:Uncharacterized protein n=1 Tax=Cymbomonas tetramitiformis TaxID=36881 RepID=A0AAE0BTI4_9CHLO|nr:hypothetical protein CYMTET_48609 [Cymbomonas tetramitiformis]
MLEHNTPPSEVSAHSPVTNFITEASITPGSAAWQRGDVLSTPLAGTSAVATVAPPIRSIAGPSLFPSLPSNKPIKPTAAAIWKANSNVHAYTFKSLRLPRSMLSPSQGQPADPHSCPTGPKSLTSPNKVTCRF